MTNTNYFSLEHVVKYDTKEVWIKYDNSISVMAIPALVNKYYPGYIGHIVSGDYLSGLRNQLAN